MPFRLNEYRAKIQFVTSARTPALVYKACVATDCPSNTVYIQHAVAEALSRDLGIPLQELLDELPPTRGRSGTRFDASRRPIPGPGNTIEQVK